MEKVGNIYFMLNTVGKNSKYVNTEWTTEKQTAVAEVASSSLLSPLSHADSQSDVSQDNSLSVEEKVTKQGNPIKTVFSLWSHADSTCAVVWTS